MQFFNARPSSQGFTIIEILIILLTVGILSAISAPSFLGLLNRTKVNNAVMQVQGALQGAHREAMRKSKNCTVIISTGSSVTLKSPPEDTNNNKVLDSGEDLNSNGLLDTNNCLLTGDRTLSNEVAMATNVEANTTVPGNSIPITFDIQGNTKFTTASDKPGIIILYQINESTSNRKCVAISKGIGILRTGTYPDSDSLTPPNKISDTCTQKKFES